MGYKCKLANRYLDEDIAQLTTVITQYYLFNNTILVTVTKILNKRV